MIKVAYVGTGTDNIFVNRYFVSNGKQRGQYSIKGTWDILERNSNSGRVDMPKDVCADIAIYGLYVEGIRRIWTSNETKRFSEKQKRALSDKFKEDFEQRFDWSFKF